MILIFHFSRKVSASTPSRPLIFEFSAFSFIYFYQHDWVWLNLGNSQSRQLSFFLWPQLLLLPIFIHFIVSFQTFALSTSLPPLLLETV